MALRCSALSGFAIGLGEDVVREAICALYDISGGRDRPEGPYYDRVLLRLDVSILQPCSPSDFRFAAHAAFVVGLHNEFRYGDVLPVFAERHEREKRVARHAAVAGQRLL